MTLPDPSKVPSGNRCTVHAKDLGPEVWHEYKSKREEYKREGLTPREAIERAYTELEIGPRWVDLKERRAVAATLGSGVPLTPVEVKSAIPSYQDPTAIRAEEVGDQEMTEAEAIEWAQFAVAKVRSGMDAPLKFPSPRALFWYQSAVKMPDKFLHVVQRTSTGGVDGDNLYLQDSQYQFAEIDKQLRSALEEVGSRLSALEEETKAGVLQERLYGP